MNLSVHVAHSSHIFLMIINDCTLSSLFLQEFFVIILSIKKMRKRFVFMDDYHQTYQLISINTNNNIYYQTYQLSKIPLNFDRICIKTFFRL